MCRILRTSSNKYQIRNIDACESVWKSSTYILLMILRLYRELCEVNRVNERENLLQMEMTLAQRRQREEEGILEGSWVPYKYI